jgi:hypothetical protein
MVAIHTIDTLDLGSAHRAEQFGAGKRHTRLAAGGSAWSRPGIQVAASAVAVIAVIVTSAIAGASLTETQPTQRCGIAQQGDACQ